MTAPTALTPVQLTRNGSITLAAGAAGDATNGNTAALAGASSRHCMILVTNADSGAAHVFTLKAGPNLGTNGADLAVSVPLSSQKLVGPVDSSQYCQADGSMLMTVASTQLKINIFHE
jgi:hypothetical protein